MTVSRPRLDLPRPTAGALAGLGLDQLVDALAERVAGMVVARIDARLAAAAQANDDTLLSYQQVADLLTAGVPPPSPDVQRPTAEYVADLARRGELPGVPFGKYRRIRWGDYRAWVARHREGGLDTGLSSVLSPVHDRRRGAAAPPATGAHAGRTRRPSRRAFRNGVPVGNRGGAHPGTDGATPPPARADGTEEEV